MAYPYVKNNFVDGAPPTPQVDDVVWANAVETGIRDAHTIDLSPDPDGDGLISGAVAINMSGIQDGYYAAKLSGTATITVSNLARMATICFRIIQSATGGHLLTFAITGGVVRWEQNVVPVLTAATNATDYFLGVGSPSGLHMDAFVVGQNMA
jgi:hypothetical protein